MKNNLDISKKLSLCETFTVKVNKYLFPISVNIKNIYTYNDESLEIGLLGDYNDELAYEYKMIKKRKYYKRYLKHINVEDELYNNLTKNFLQYHNLKNIEDIFSVLDESDVDYLISEIVIMESLVVSEFRRRLWKELKIDKKKPHIRYKPKNVKPPNISEYTSYTQGYIFTQTFKEFNPTIFFEENIGKSVNEWSLREIELHQCYITQKYRVDEVNNLWEASCIDKQNKTKD